MLITTRIVAQKSHCSRNLSFLPIFLGIFKLSQKEQPFQNELCIELLKLANTFSEQCILSEFKPVKQFISERFEALTILVYFMPTPAILNQFFYIYFSFFCIFSVIGTKISVSVTINYSIFIRLIINSDFFNPISNFSYKIFYDCSIFLNYKSLFIIISVFK